MFTDKRCTAAHILIFFVLNVFNFRKSSATWMDLRTMDYMQSSMDSTKPGISEAMDGIWYDDHWYKNVRGYEGTRKWHASLCNVEKAEDCTKCAYLAANDTDGWFAVSLGSPTDILAVDILGRRDKRSKANLNGLAVYTTNLTKDQLTPVLNKQDYAALQQCGDQLATGNRFQTFRCERFGVRWVIIRVAQAHAAICEVGVVNTGWLDLKDKELLRSHRTYPIFDAHIAVLGGGNWLPNTRGFRLPCRDKPRYWAVNLGELTDIVQVAAMTRDRLPERLARTKVYTGGDLPTEEVKKMLNNKDYRSFKLCQQIPKNLERNRWNNLVCPTPSVKWVILHWLNPCGSVVEVGVRQAAFDECLHNFCLNNATCTDLTPGFSCTCQPGFTGIYCQIDINECESLPCLNGATCDDLVAHYRCFCAPGFTGPDCDININECESSPCVLPGICWDEVNAYQCYCSETTAGHNCEIDIRNEHRLEGEFKVTIDSSAINSESLEYMRMLEAVMEFLKKQCGNTYNPDFECDLQAFNCIAISTGLHCFLALGVTPRIGDAPKPGLETDQGLTIGQSAIRKRQVEGEGGPMSGSGAPAPPAAPIDLPEIPDEQPAATQALPAPVQASEPDEEVPPKKLVDQMAGNAGEFPQPGKLDIYTIIINGISFGRKIKIEPNIGYALLGCFAYTEKDFTQLTQQLPFTTETNNTEWTNETCPSQCRELHTFTYAGLHAYDHTKCKCFNSVDRLQFINNTEQTGCSNIARKMKEKHLEVYTTCPQGYYNPPMCNTRAKQTCLEISHRAYALFDGTCENCKQLKGETGWEGCHYIDEAMAPKIIDFRYMTAMSPVQPLTREDALSPVSAIGLTLSTVRPNEYYTDDRVQVFVHRIRAMLLARGACYLSTWSRLASDYVSLLDKFFMNTGEDYEVVEFHNVNMHLPTPYYTDLAVHTIDTMKALGSSALPVEYQGIVMKTVSSNTMASDMDDFIASFSNVQALDDHQGSGAWRRGTELNVNQCGGAEECSPANKLFTSISLVAELVNTCPQMCDKDQCNDDLSCKHGCKSGYYGKYCDKGCPEEYFGQNCDTICNYGCVLRKCNAISGVCSHGCIHGHSGVFCDIPCPEGLYGRDCAGVCSEHCVNQSCSPRSGYCHDCHVGFKMPYCDKPCDFGSWGHLCARGCGNCADNETCDLVTGRCAACEEGYRPPDCHCSVTQWGQECNKQCGSCKDGRSCHPETGYCPTQEDTPWGEEDEIPEDPSQVCDNSTQPPMCLCKYGQFGPKCDQSCGNCAKGYCDDRDGKCTLGCLPGFTGEMCNDPCEEGTYGQDCGCVCPPCEQTCFPTNGTCPGGTCQGNYQPPECMGCKPGFYGEECEKKCGGCRGDLPCKRDGWCPGDANRDYGDALPDGDTKVDDSALPAKVNDLSNSSINDSLKNESRKRREIAAGKVGCPSSEDAGPVSISDPCSEFKDYKAHGSRKLSYVELLALIRCGALAGRPVTDKQFNDIQDAVNGICKSPQEMQGPTCECKIGTWGNGCTKRCGHCMAGCLPSDGVCIGGCAPGWVGADCSKPCEQGFYGPNCVFECAHCIDDQCHATNGSCKEGCQSRYMPPYCKCALGFFGGECEQECGYCASDTCSFFDGTCPKEDGCQEPYIGPYCNCTIGTYGIDCDQECGHCANNEICNYYDGGCEGGCMPGYTGEKCTEKCPRGFWGHLCTQPCGRCGMCAPCDPVDGSCPGQCEMGYMPPRCNSWCNATFYGEDCKRSCGNCFAGRPCDHEDGFCDNGCQPGYMPPDCTKSCEGTNKFGYNCQYECGHCKGGAQCNPFTGSCEAGCDEPYKGTNCDVYAPSKSTTTVECDLGFYNPPKCDKKCGNCIQDSYCHRVHGFCEAGCAAGYRTGYCNKECDDGFFGVGCSDTCGHCKSGKPCRKSDGDCPDGCAKGYMGPKCKSQRGQSAQQRGRWVEASSVRALAANIHLCLSVFTIVVMIC